jgi:2',3'-cyclic-nucleotide 2'-phosphodiesterase (5'-nucleotidase family)
VHAHVTPVDLVAQRPAKGSLAQAATLIGRVRRESTAVLVLDGGDAIEGTPVAHYALVDPSPTTPDPTIAAMNVIGYDAAVIGNHEFNYGLDTLRRSLSGSHFPWLAANIEGTAAVQLPIGREKVITRGGVKVGILGLTSPNVPHWDPASHWKGLTFADPVATAASAVASLRPRCDVLVVVLHAGFERDLDSGASNETDFENSAWRIAQLPGVDLLLTGHTHRDIAPRKVGGTLVAQPGRWAELVTRIDLTLRREGRRWQIADWKGANLPTSAETADEAVLAAVAPAVKRAESELARPIGELVAPLKVGGLPTADDAGGDLIHAVQLEATGAELSLAAPIGMASMEFPAGPVTPRLAHALYPYPNTLLVVALSGAQLRQVLEHAVRGWNGLDCGRPEACLLLRDPKLPPYNYDSLQGASYLVNPLAPVGTRVRGLHLAGRDLGSDTLVTVAINSYRGAGGGNFPFLGTAPRVKEVDRPMVDLIVEYFERHGKVTPQADDNWGITVPLTEFVPGRAPRR